MLHHYPAKPWPVIDPIDPDGAHIVGFDWSQWLASIGATQIDSAVWSVSDGLTITSQYLIPDGSGNNVESAAVLTATTAPVNVAQTATCTATAGLATEQRTMRVPVRQL